METWTAIQRRVKSILVRTNSFPIVHRLNRWITFGILRACVFFFARCPGVRSIYLRHSMLGADYIPWGSDIDLDVVLSDHDEAEAIRVSQRVWRTRDRLHRLFPILGEVEVFQDRELRCWLQHGGLESFDVLRWQRLHGEAHDFAALKDPADVRDFDVAIECFNLLFWQLYGVIALPSFCGEQFVKAFLKVLRVHACVARGLDGLLRLTRKELFEQLGEDEPELHGLLARIRTALPTNHLSGDMKAALGILCDRVFRLEAVLAADEGSRTRSYRMPSRSRVETHEHVEALLAPFVARVEGIAGVESLHLVQGRMGDSGAIGHFNFKLYVVVSDAALADIADILSVVTACFLEQRPAWPFNFFGACSIPIVLSRPAFRFATRVWDPMEALALEPPATESVSLSDLVRRRAASQFSLSSLHLRGLAFNRPFLERTADDFGAELTLIDSVFTLAHLRLFLDEGIIALAPRDVVRAHQEAFLEEAASGRWLESFYERYASVRTVSEMRSRLSMQRLHRETAAFVRDQQRALSAALEREAGPAPGGRRP